MLLFSAYYHITKVIEASRVHLFDIVTQYRAIFSDDDPIFMMEEDHALNYANILHAWIGRKVCIFKLNLNITGGRRQDILALIEQPKLVEGCEEITTWFSLKFSSN